MFSAPKETGVLASPTAMREDIFSVVRQFGICALLAMAAPGWLCAQADHKPSPVTLRQAVAIALEKNPQRKAALADGHAASAEIKIARSALLPQLAFTETITRGNDPVYVFGSRLRQQAFTAADFALPVLNTPTPLSNFATRFGGSWNLFDSLATPRGIERAERMKEAAGHELERADQEIIFRVVDAYYAVLLAQKHAEVAEHAVSTAQAILDRSKDRFDSGVVVESDYLSSQVRLAARKEELIRSQNNLALARTQLSTVLGSSGSVEFVAADALAEKMLPGMSLEDVESRAVRERPDLKQIHAQRAAQERGVAMAKSAFGPRVTGFAEWEADNPSFASGGGTNWNAGVEVRMELFQGGAKRAELSHQQALEEKVAAAEEVTTDSIRMEVRRAFYDVDAASREAEVAKSAIAAAQESLRINQNRYDSGLSTISDLLSAEEAARRSQSDYWDTIYRYHTSYASLELAGGTLGPQSPVVAQ
jgi:outer membrane protein TolC